MEQEGASETFRRRSPVIGLVLLLVSVSFSADAHRYGQTVGEVILPDGRVLNHELVRAGLAWWYRRYAPDDAALERLEQKARAAKRGLWADAEPVPPWAWRRRR